MPNSYFGVGTSKPTIGSIIFEPGKNVAKDLDFVNGDGTVPYTSAIMLNQLKSKVASNRFREFSCDHTKIIQEVQPINWVLYLLGTQIGQAPNNIVSNSTPYMVLRAACPVDISIAKGQERLSSAVNSFNPTTNFGSLYFLGEDNNIKMAVIDDGNYSVQMVSTGTGTMDYSIRFFSAANNLEDEKNFWDVPITETTIITTGTNTNDGIVLYVDVNGDGIVDKTIQPSDSQSQNNTNFPSSSSDRGTSNTNTYTNVAVDPLANLLTRVKTAIENAAKESPVGQPVNATVQVKNATKITLAMLKQATDTAKQAGGSVILHFDTMSANGKIVLTRLYVKPELATIDIILSVNEARAKNVKELFEKYFKNKIAVLSLDQQGSFGVPVEIATKIDLSGMGTKNLYFYSYDKATNAYRRIEKPAYWIDKNGYLHFTTELAGDIIISNGALEKK